MVSQGPVRPPPPLPNLVTLLADKISVGAFVVIGQRDINHTACGVRVADKARDKKTTATML